MCPDIVHNGIRDSSVSIVTRLRAGRSGVAIPAWKKFCLFSRKSTPPLDFTYFLIEWTSACFFWVKWPGREAHHSSSSSVEIKKEWICASKFVYGFTAYMRLALPVLIEIGFPTFSSRKTNYYCLWESPQIRNTFCGENGEVFWILNQTLRLVFTGLST